MWQDESPDVLGKPEEPSAFDNMLNKIGSVEEQILQTAQILDEIVTRLEGPKPTEAENTKDKTTSPSILGHLSDRLQETDEAAGNTLRIAQHLDRMIR